MPYSVGCIVLAVVCCSVDSGLAVRMLNGKPNATNDTTTQVLEGVDFTEKFAVANKTYTLDNITYYCCCQMNSNATDVTCELVDVLSKRVGGLRNGCGAVKGTGWHSWYNMKKLAKYKHFEHAGKCIVPAEKLETLPTTTTTTTTTINPEQLVDVTDKFFRDGRFLLGGPKNLSVSLGEVLYSCCCRMDSNQTDVTCELVDVRSKGVSQFKKGCGGLKGDGFHDWSKIKTLTKYKGFEHAGKCMVPWKKLGAFLSYL